VRLAAKMALHDFCSWLNEQCGRPRLAAISGALLSAVISIRYILGFRKDNSNVFNMLVQNLPIASGIKYICC
jgi:hypothetical protein